MSWKQAELGSWSDLVFKIPGSENRAWLLGAEVGRRAVYIGTTQNFRGDGTVLYHDCGGGIATLCFFRTHRTAESILLHVN